MRGNNQHLRYPTRVTKNSISTSKRIRWNSLGPLPSIKGYLRKYLYPQKILDSSLLYQTYTCWLGEGGYFFFIIQISVSPCLHIWVELTYFFLPLCLSSSSPPSPLLFHTVLLILPDTILHFLFCKRLPSWWFTSYLFSSRVNR